MFLAVALVHEHTHVWEKLKQAENLTHQGQSCVFWCQACDSGRCRLLFFPASLVCHPLADQKRVIGAGKTAQQGRVCIALVKDLGSVPTTQMAACNYL